VDTGHHAIVGPSNTPIRGFRRRRNPLASIGRASVGPGKERRLQRLFSTFPHGSPGVGLLLLRAGAAAVLIVQGDACLAFRPAGTWGTWVAGATEILAGALLVLGLTTPLAGVVGAIGTAGAALSWFPWPMPLPAGTGIGSVLRVLVMVAIALLGPGAISADAVLFGRREIAIPRLPETARED
jgi:uncharacterized membrane protein YphA (DoxX/SURF4 family)